MKKVFVSLQPTGRTDEEILAVRAKAVEAVQRLLGEEACVIGSSVKCAPAEAEPLRRLGEWLRCLGESLKLMSGADVVYFEKGWKGARNCIIEHNCAIVHEIVAIDDGGLIQDETADRN